MSRHLGTFPETMLGSIRRMDTEEVMARPLRRKDHGVPGEVPTVGGGQVPGDCPASRAMDLVAQKWSVHILFALHEAGQPGHLRHLQRTVKPIARRS
jgi:DNA-binding HxlR family transcriptional regulator